MTQDWSNSTSIVDIKREVEGIKEEIEELQFENECLSNWLRDAENDIVNLKTTVIILSFIVLIIIFM